MFCSNHRQSLPERGSSHLGSVESNFSLNVVKCSDRDRWQENNTTHSCYGKEIDNQKARCMDEL